MLVKNKREERNMLKKFFSWVFILALICFFCSASFGCSGKQDSLEQSSVEREMERADEANKELEN